MSLEGESIPPDAPRYRCEYCGLNTAVVIPRRFHRARIVALIIEATILFPIALIGTPLFLLLIHPGGWAYLPMLPMSLIKFETWEELLGATPRECYYYLVIFTLIYVGTVVSVSYFPPYSTSRRIYCLQCHWEKKL